ncbi:cyclophilin-like fold protein [Paenibacillus mucilaginosus]|uniref:Cyclophilin-like domain-containing protein n=3 Tax=Paenibacillus mucilaginosus TaxID=61624 RepID=I0BJD9_9BACL|nr:cyclophilin-like fold protein [Paenibacillus mucilaginosus]AEI41705.1 hypothetical protein KNP414_03147 [Paenibacillus mucilaginosus KNP414]AFH62486.1 hypothetical protein B2K_17460 [Paenibacillus mucilaginosus K02]MCG7214397.1 hypothetical protein [Paenibacillus mucilaginosus]WDM30683.1 hypothetical protein KCX80_16660 [Paenibacillus mucilaginosus]WFA18861.1 hypothetical protein ERY13_17035 [Paenibacillus mucilaginosus]
MKNVITLSAAAAIVLASCGGDTGSKRLKGGSTVSSEVRIKMSFHNQEVIVKMDDHPTSRDFINQLPLTLTFEDYAGTEKISMLTRRLNTESAPSGFDPAAGDFTYYSPWGNLALFYRDFGYSSGLIKLGHIESGREKLADLNGEVTLQRVETGGGESE